MHVTAWDFVKKFSNFVVVVVVAVVVVVRSFFLRSLLSIGEKDRIK